MKIATVSEMREIDKIAIEERGIPGLDLMEQAGKSVADFICEKLSPRKIAIVTGKGNNAGDGFVTARLLALKGLKVYLLLLSPADELKGDALTNFARLPEDIEKISIQNAGEVVPYFNHSDVIVDAILGTGVSGEVTGLYGEVIKMINSSEKPVIAVDIPSGLLGDGGWSGGPVVKANWTVTMGIPKLGMVIYPGVLYTGELKVAPLSFPDDLLKSDKLKHNLIEIGEVKSFFPERKADSNKRTFGYVFIVAGSPGLTGAAILAGKSAARSGAGIVYIGIPQNLNPIIETSLIEPVSIPLLCRDGYHLDSHSIKKILEISQKVDVVAIGPGIGTNLNTWEAVQDLIKVIEKPLVLDADGINAIQDYPDVLKKRKYPTIITPHPGEMARILKTSPQEIQKERIKVAGDFSKNFGVITVLKGARTIIADSDGTICVNPTGNSGLAKGGSGDVLTGLISGFLAQGMTPLKAAIAGVFIHGLSADLAVSELDERFLLPSDIINYLNKTFKHLKDVL